MELKREVNTMTTEEKAVAAIWWRTSTKAQTESSPETQIREAREMLEAQGYSVPDDYIIGADWHSLSILDCPQGGDVARLGAPR